MFKSITLTKKSYRYLAIFVCLFLFNSPSFSKGNCVSGDCINGSGRMTFSNGDKFEGDFKNGQPTYGKVTLTNGDEYFGELKNNLFDGAGSFTKKMGEGLYIREGLYKNGQLNGRGMITLPDGNKYQGNFVNGKLEGKGTYTFKGGVYEGEFKNNMQNGHGVTTYESGDVYIGEWNNDKGIGEVIIIRANGTKVKGNWENGKIMLEIPLTNPLANKESDDRVTGSTFSQGSTLGRPE